MALLAGMAFTSCEDYLDSESKSSYTEKVVFSNPSLAEDAVINIYSFSDRPIRTVRVICLIMV